jgi:TonB family protein
MPPSPFRVAIAALAVAAARPLPAVQSATTYVNSAENRYHKGDVDGALADLTQAIAIDPKNAEAYFERGFITMQRVAPDGRDDRSAAERRRAISDFTQAVSLNPKHAAAYAFRSSLQEQLGSLDLATADARQALALDPTMWLPHRTLVNVWWDRAYLDKSAGIDAKRKAIAEGVKEADIAIGLNADDASTVMMKSLLLRLQATIETDAERQKALVAQADIYRDRALQLQQRQVSTPPAPPTAPAPATGAAAPVRVGGDIASPRQIVNVKPVYPPIAVSARLQGDVVVEATIDPQGNVTDAVVTQSPKLAGLPVFDQAALTAVRQWKFEPTRINGVAVPVVMTVNVTFSLK